MAYTTVYNGIIFIEGREPSAKIISSVEYKKRFSYNSQIKTLDCVKEQLSEKAIELGGNAVVEFKYGQKSAGWFRASLLALDDDVKWYGSGYVAVLPPDLANDILKKHSNKN